MISWWLDVWIHRRWTIRNQQTKRSQNGNEISRSSAFLFPCIFLISSILSFTILAGSCLLVLRQNRRDQECRLPEGLLQLGLTLLQHLHRHVQSQENSPNPIQQAESCRRRWNKQNKQTKFKIEKYFAFPILTCIDINYESDLPSYRYSCVRRSFNEKPEVINYFRSSVCKKDEIPSDEEFPL